jgi:MYXO-CTERM domain-containing protein
VAVGGVGCASSGSTTGAGAGGAFPILAAAALVGRIRRRAGARATRRP